MKAKEIAGVAAISVGVLVVSILLPILLTIFGAILVGMVIYNLYKGDKDE